MLKVANSVISASRITGVLPVVNGGTGVTTSTGTGNTVLSASPTLSGDVNLSTGNLVVADGKGIDFSATSSGSGTMTSELLADYEEGTWTPTITFGAVSTGITYTLNEGLYTKIGDQVFLTGVIQLSSKGSATGYADLRSLPFTVKNANGSGGGAAMKIANISFSGAFQGYAAPNSTLISLSQITLLGVVTDITDTNFSNNSSIIFSVNYKV